MQALAFWLSKGLNLKYKVKDRVLFATPMAMDCVMIAAGSQEAVRQTLRGKGPKMASSLASETAPASREKDPKTELVTALHPARNRECRMEPVPEWAVREMAGVGNPEEEGVVNSRRIRYLNSRVSGSLSIRKDRPKL